MMPYLGQAYLGAEGDVLDEAFEQRLASRAFLQGDRGIRW